jgi:hypothetical protein
MEENVLNIRTKIQISFVMCRHKFFEVEIQNSRAVYMYVFKWVKCKVLGKCLGCSCLETNPDNACACQYIQ